MNLLLAAIKKTEERKPSSPAALQLQDIQASPSVTSRKPDESHTSNTGKTYSLPPSEKELVATKLFPLKKRLYIGLIPFSLICGSLIFLAGSFYVYHQISTPRQHISHKVTPSANIASPVAAPPPANMATILSLVPLASTSKITTSSEVTEEPSILSSSHATKFTDEKSTAMNIRHQPDTNTIDPILTSAYQAYQNGDFTNALQRYHDALAQDPQNRDALLGLATIAQQQGQDEAALQYYRRVLIIDPNDPVANAALASFGTGNANIKEARLKQLIARQPESAALHFALGNQYADQSRWAEAQQSYFNALAAEPGCALFAFNLAISLDHLGQPNSAVQYYRKALQLDTTGQSGFTHEQVQQRLIQLTGS